MIKKAEPNEAHLVLSKYNIPIVTMNVDMLHFKAREILEKNNKIIDIHGSFDEVFCPKCKKNFDFEFLKTQIKCPNCSIILEPNITLYGDSFDYKKLNEAYELMAWADYLLVIGTSRYTNTGIILEEFAYMRGTEIITINENAEKRLPEFLDRVFSYYDSSLMPTKNLNLNYFLR